MPVTLDYIEGYIRQLLTQGDEGLQRLEQYAKNNHIPIIQPEIAKLLTILIRMGKPKNVLEVGTAIGYSTLVMAKAMEGRGRIVTIERDSSMVDSAYENISSSPYRDMITIKIGDALDIMANIQDEYDLVFIDGCKGHYIDLLPHCTRIINKGGLLICDNVLFRGMIANNELVKKRKITIVKRMRKFLNHLCSHPLYDTIIIPMGDGVSISYKKEEARVNE
ncbi:MAG: O-methyltransferase [Mahellales bacterium]|jgi:predicted O-methyltransferase YrrM